VKGSVECMTILLPSTLICEGVMTSSGYFTAYVRIGANASYPGRINYEKQTRGELYMADKMKE
jgi:hypothetical protein